MITYKTQFPLNKERTLEDLLRIGLRWINGSPHSSLRSSLDCQSSLDEELCYYNEKESLTLVNLSCENQVCGVRYVNDDEGRRWTTEVVGSKCEDSFWVSVQLGVDSEYPVENIRVGKRPYIMKMIMRELGGGQDGAFDVSDKPISLCESDVDIAASVISGCADLIMPVVYVSADGQGGHLVDCKEMASRLFGMAHVLSEPSRDFSFKLRRCVDGKNVYAGAVGIYWPDRLGRRVFILGNGYDDRKEMMNAVESAVRFSLLSQRTRRGCSWSYIQEMKSKRKIRELIDSGSNSVDDYIKAFDSEINTKNEEISRLEQEIYRLKNFSNFNVIDREQSSGPIVLSTSERELYQGEMLNIILDSLESTSSSCESGSRRKAVIDDLIAANGQPSEREEIIRDLKSVLKQYKSMSAHCRSVLERLGFSILEDGKHYKLVFREDERFPVALAKTCGDTRSGINTVSDIKRKLF